MRWLGRPMLFNGPDWGVVSKSFVETRVAPADTAMT
jgi:hypothetical protein